VKLWLALVVQRREASPARSPPDSFSSHVKSERLEIEGDFGKMLQA
jgi:hypothetical protein